MNNDSNPTTSQKKIGIISDAHGIRGEVYGLVFSGDMSWLEKAKSLTLQKPGGGKSQVVAIKKAKPFKKGFIAALENIVTRNQAEELKKFEIWIDESVFISEDGAQPFLSELLGFVVTDVSLGMIGSIVAFSSNGIQDLLVLDKTVNEQNIEIPFVKEFVLEVDYKNKKMQTDLPEGLVQINEKD